MAKRQLALATSGMFAIFTAGHPYWTTVNITVDSPSKKRKIKPKIDKRSNLKGSGNFSSIQLL
jgi:hypothetical protein